MEVMGFQMKGVIIVESRGFERAIDQEPPVGIEERSGFLGSVSDGISHELGFVSGGVGELVEGEVSHKKREILVTKLQGFQKKGWNSLINLPHSIKFLLFSRDALLELQMDGNIVG